MLTATDRQLLHACRAKRYLLTGLQVSAKAVTRAPHPQHPKGMPCASTPEPAKTELTKAWEAYRTQQTALLRAMYTEGAQATAITALHIIEAEIRGLKPSHKENGATPLGWYRSVDPAARGKLDEWLKAA